MFKKFYTANLVRDGVPIGYALVGVWFFQSAWTATNKIDRVARNYEANAIDIRRLK